MNLFQLRFKIFLVFVKILAILFGIKEFPPIPSVSAVIKRNNKLLFIKPTYKKTLGLPGGVIQELETPKQALVREVKEETGLDIKVGKLLGIYPSKGIVAGINFCYEAKIAGGRLKKSKEGKPIWLEPRTALKRVSGLTNPRIIRNHGGMFSTTI